MELVITLVMCILVFGLLGSGGGGGCTVKLGNPTKKRPPHPKGQGITNKPKEEIEVQDDNT